MITIIDESYSIKQIKDMILKALSKDSYKKYSGQYGISKDEIKQYAMGDAEKLLNRYDLDEDDYLEIQDFMNSLSFPITLYRGITNANRNEIRTGKQSGICWTTNIDFIKKQKHLGKFNYVMIGDFDKSDIDFDKTILQFLGYSLSTSSHVNKYGKEPENEIIIKKNKEPKNLQLLDFAEFCSNY
jgi:hypothetical protein